QAAAQFDVTAPTITDAVAALERKGLLRRRRQDGDARGGTLTLTPAGREVAGHLAGRDAPMVAAGRARDHRTQDPLLSTPFALIAVLQRAGVVTVARMCVTCRHFRPGAHPGRPAPHHCTLLDTALAPAELRLDCPEYEQEHAAQGHGN